MRHKHEPLHRGIAGRSSRFLFGVELDEQLIHDIEKSTGSCIKVVAFGVRALPSSDG